MRNTEKKKTEVKNDSVTSRVSAKGAQNWETGAPDADPRTGTPGDEQKPSCSRINAFLLVIRFFCRWKNMHVGCKNSSSYKSCVALVQLKAECTGGCCRHLTSP